MKECKYLGYLLIKENNSHEANANVRELINKTTNAMEIIWKMGIVAGEE